MDNTWQDGLAGFLVGPAVLVGIGNRLRGDDAFGPTLIDRLRGRVGWPLIDAGDVPENFVGKIVASGASRALLLDSARWGGVPGEIGFFLGEEIPWGGVSTHGASLRLLCDLLRARGGCTSALLGAEPVGMALSAPLSPPMAESISAAAAFLMRLAVSKEEKPSRNMRCRST